MLKYEYLDNIRDQYINATGDITKRKYENDFNDRFVEWLQYRNLTSFVLYKNLLNECGIDYNSGRIIEVGKSSIDSLTNKFSYTTLITPYLNSFDLGRLDKRKIIKGELHCYGIEPLIRDKVNPTLYPSVKLPEADLVITHNPYFTDNIKCWQKLSNEKRDILVGVFGNLGDKDYTIKIAMLENLKNKLINGAIEKYEVKDDNYAYIIMSKKRVK